MLRQPLIVSVQKRLHLEEYLDELSMREAALIYRSDRRSRLGCKSLAKAGIVLEVIQQTQVYNLGRRQLRELLLLL